jgi:hypothetical protein
MPKGAVGCPYLLLLRLGLDFPLSIAFALQNKNLRVIGFRLRKPRPLIAKADPEQQEAFKKNC